MIVTEREFDLDLAEVSIAALREAVCGALARGEVPVRFAFSSFGHGAPAGEVGTVQVDEPGTFVARDAIFSFRRREREHCGAFTSVLIIPTGIGAALGGHSGDGGAAARLFASACDTLVTHPNVVNGADINELPENGLYVEGSVICRLLMGTAGLSRVRANRILVILDEHGEAMFQELAVNSVSAARASLGIDCSGIVVMRDRALMRALFSKSGRAVGRIERLELVFRVLEEHAGAYDAVALSTLIDVPTHYHSDYFKEDFQVNPWGGVEAMLTHALSLRFGVPTAHAPMMSSSEIMNLDVGVVDPRKAAEAVSTTYLHCVLKGLHRSPKITQPGAGDLDAEDVSCLVMPYGCVGLPTLAAAQQGIPVIAVRDESCQSRNRMEEVPFRPGKFFVADNYLEAAGIMQAIKAGVAVETVRRPLHRTEVVQQAIEGEHREQGSFPSSPSEAST